jgi:uncharacterized glyoxalase superfamily protein PhnB
MRQVIAYLSFDGTCADAMRFYEQALAVVAMEVVPEQAAEWRFAAQG